MYASYLLAFAVAATISILLVSAGVDVCKNKFREKRVMLSNIYPDAPKFTYERGAVTVQKDNSTVRIVLDGRLIFGFPNSISPGLIEVLQYLMNDRKLTLVMESDIKIRVKPRTRLTLRYLNKDGKHMSGTMTISKPITEISQNPSAIQLVQGFYNGINETTFDKNEYITGFLGSTIVHGYTHLYTFEFPCTGSLDRPT